MQVWKVPKIWDNGECWIIGGGSSIIEQFSIPFDIVELVRTKQAPLSIFSKYMEAIHSKHVIGVNAAFKLGRWIDFCFFGDTGWFEDNKVALARFAGIKVTSAPIFAKREMHYPGIKYLSQDVNKSHGISSVPYTVCWNANSGAAAISLAAHLGAKKIVLLGFDMQLGSQGTSHWHNEYPKSVTRNPVFIRHLRGFPSIAKDAESMGIEIVNASPNSVIDCFPKISVGGILNG